jgi:predicted lipid-binding transport protein (Tim44 family)
MRTITDMRTTTSRALVVLLMLVTLAVAGEAWARAGSGGSRGSRSYSPPARPAPTSPTSPSTPSRSPGTSMTSPAPRPSPFGGIMGALGGFMIGGLLGSLLFGGLGGGGGFGIGFFDILLIGGGLFLLFRLMRSRRQEPAYAGAPGYGSSRPAAWEAPAGSPPVSDDLERGLGHVRQMDPRFDAAVLAADGADVFRAVQNAVSGGDLSPVRARLTAEMQAHLEGQAEALRRVGRVNRVERIQIERAEVTEAWQEGGHDLVTVLLSGSLIDYTVDAGGSVVSGSRTAPERFEEFWTFTRPVGPNAWKLTAIQTA